MESAADRTGAAEAQSSSPAGSEFAAEQPAAASPEPRGGAVRPRPERSSTPSLTTTPASSGPAARRRAHAPSEFAFE
jgi:hypothetical protein